MLEHLIHSPFWVYYNKVASPIGDLDYAATEEHARDLAMDFPDAIYFVVE